MMHHSLRIVEMDVRSREVRAAAAPDRPVPFRPGPLVCAHAAAARRVPTRCEVRAQDLETLRGADFDEIDV